MATTTNYGWTTPDDTSLVKDGASAIRTLGSSVDTTVKALNPETTLGDISYRSATANTKTRLAIGTSGQVLSVNGSGVPAWTTISSGGMTLISETVASANTSLSLSAIPGTYKQLHLYWTGIYHSNNSTYFDLRFNNSSSAIHSENWLFSYGTGNVAQNDYNTRTTMSISAFGEQYNGSSTSTGQFGRGWLIIDDYASTTKVKQYKFRTQFFVAGIGELMYDGLGFWNSTSAITSLDVVRTSGTGSFTNGTNTSIRLYGVS
jgi:hypothetical protein